MTLINIKQISNFFFRLTLTIKNVFEIKPNKFSSMISTSKITLIILVFTVIPSLLQAQTIKDSEIDNTGYLSMGARNSFGIFTTNGKYFVGTGAGGQFALQIAKNFNSQWFSDWIVSNIDNKAQRSDFHSGFSMMPEVISLRTGKTQIAIFPIGGFCIDYTKFSITTGNNYTFGPATVERYSFAAQVGAGLTIPISNKFDFTFDVHYMTHIGTDVDIKMDDIGVILVKDTGTNLEGHLFFAISMDYKLFRIW